LCEKITLPAEADIIAEGDRRTKAFLAGRMAELRSKIGASAFDGNFFPLRAGKLIGPGIRLREE
jgi:hypothetical protein